MRTMADSVQILRDGARRLRGIEESCRSRASGLIFALALISMATAAPLAPVAAATYYVSNGGSNGSSGLSPAAAWKTLQFAADTVQAGDTVIVLPGTYAGFNLFTSGASGAPITFTGNPGVPAPNPAVIINANNTFTNKDRINLEGASFVVIEGFTLLGSGNPATNRACIRAVGSPDDPSRFVSVLHNRCDLGGTWGIFTGFVDDMLVDGNEASRSAQQHGIYLSNSGDRPVVRRNVIWGNHSAGLHMNGDVSQGGDGVISHALVERNVIFDNGDGDPAFGAPGGAAINADGVQDSVFRNNLLWDNHKTGIALFRQDGGGPASGNLVHSNTIHNAVDARWCLHIGDGATGNTVRNNVLLNDHAFRGAIEITSDCLPGFSSDAGAVKDRFSLDDTFLSLAQWKAATGQDGASFVATASALFVDASTGDYALLPASPAIDTGGPFLAPADDLQGWHRPAGAGFDIGAHEFGACFGIATTYGAGLAGSGGQVPLLLASGCPDLGAALTLTVSQSLGGAPSLLLVGGAPIALPKFGGTLLVSPIVSVALGLGGATGVPGAGGLSLPALVPDAPAFAGVTFTLQLLVVDTGAVAGVAMSAGLAVQLGAPEG